jgi:hypothetical protein
MGKLIFAGDFANKKSWLVGIKSRNPGQNEPVWLMPAMRLDRGG